MHPLSLLILSPLFLIPAIFIAAVWIDYRPGRPHRDDLRAVAFPNFHHRSNEAATRHSLLLGQISRLERNPHTQDTSPDLLDPTDPVRATLMHAIDHAQQAYLDRVPAGDRRVQTSTAHAVSCGAVHALAQATAEYRSAHPAPSTRRRGALAEAARAGTGWSALCSRSAAAAARAQYARLARESGRVLPATVQGFRLPARMIHNSTEAAAAWAQIFTTALDRGMASEAGRARLDARPSAGACDAAEDVSSAVLHTQP